MQRAVQTLIWLEWVAVSSWPPASLPAVPGALLVQRLPTERIPREYTLPT